MTTTVLRYARLNTPLGTLLAAATSKGLRTLRFCEGGQFDGAVKELRKENLDAELVHDEAALRSLLEQIGDVLAGRLAGDKVPLDLVGTAFQKRVWQTLAKVPWGKTLSYTELAQKAGRPHAVRAVASCCARNPIVFVVPCHRILAKGGGLGGYYWGLQMKRELLEREK
jgi:AraC family transcriptional regulator of adaptative response/methylated-DNA-[protein]-cysteine methyltransferase